MRVLIVKLSSMGDIIQALAAISDLHKALPNLQLDWVIDKSFAEIPLWHPAVSNIFVTNHRNWKKHPLSRATWSELSQLKTSLRQQQYDYVIDLQSNSKSALVTRMARGTRYGLAKGCTAEPCVHHLYQHRVIVPKGQHAIKRLRDLIASVFGYSHTGSADFQLAQQPWPTSPHQPQSPYLLFITNASWKNKRLPNSTWKELITKAAQQGFQVLLPWGSEPERQLATLLAKEQHNATVLPRLQLSEIASLMCYAKGAICNDTGLAHLAAALGKPTVTVYGPTNPALIAATGPHAEHIQAQHYSCLHCYKRYCKKNTEDKTLALCLTQLTAPALWKSLEQHMETSAG